MSDVQPQVTFEQPPPFRIDIQPHELLTTTTPKPKMRTLPPLPTKGSRTLPEPVCPQHPELLNSDDNYEKCSTAPTRWSTRSSG